MGWFTQFIDSSIGKKLVMALTGLFLSLFLIVHLGGNLLLLRNDDGEAFLTYSRIMASPDNFIIRIIEYGLFILLAYHIINGIRLWIINKRSRGQAYDSYNPSANSSLFSRTMILSGSIIFIFLVIHLRTFFFPYRFGSGSHEYEMYLQVHESFSSPLYSGFYVFALILLAFHLVHGVQSAFQTLGINHNKYTPFLKGLGIFFAIAICAAFAVIPIYFLFRSTSGGM
jgi:succinate dehydrogenase / fumarate reductase, cytochrome b subunit